MIGSSPPFGPAVGIGAPSPLFFGVQALTDGPRVDLESGPSSARLGAVPALAVVAVGVGAAFAI